MYFSIGSIWNKERKRGLRRPRKAQDRDHHPYLRNKIHAETEDISRSPSIPYGMGCTKESKDVGIKYAQFSQLNPDIFHC